MAPLVTVVIPSYNHERYLRQAIESVFHQTYSNVELVIVDDGSRDQSPEIIRSYALRSPMPYHMHLRTNHGAHASINFGVQQARGHYVTILNSDDFYAANRLERLVREAERTRAELLFTHVAHVDEHDRILPDNHPLRGWYTAGLERARELPTVGMTCLTFSYQVSTGNLFFTRALYDRTEGFRPYRVTHDLDFVMQVMRLSEPHVVKEQLLYYRMHTENETHKTMHLHELEGRQILRSFFTAAARDCQNELAPHPMNWPGYFDVFCEHYGPWFHTKTYAQLRADWSI